VGQPGSAASDGFTGFHVHMCYVPAMSDVGTRELRNNTRALLARVEAGETIRITVGGRPVAVLQPTGRARWMSREVFAGRLLARQADHAMRDDLAGLAPDTTDDLPLG
jgi:prevent-host-death family protein